jgi:hypothetical protein
MSKTGKLQRLVAKCCKLMKNIIEKYSPVNFANSVYTGIYSICIIRAVTKMVIFPARNANIYKICELHRAIFSSFYNNSQPNFAILLILRCSFKLW